MLRNFDVLRLDNKAISSKVFIVSGSKRAKMKENRKKIEECFWVLANFSA